MAVVAPNLLVRMPKAVAVVGLRRRWRGRLVATTPSSIITARVLAVLCAEVAQDRLPIHAAAGGDDPRTAASLHVRVICLERGDPSKE